MEIYTMHEIQYKGLKASHDADKAIFIPEPNPRGTLEERKESEDEIAMFQELVSLGFMDNTTESEKTTVDAFVERYGFGLQYFKCNEKGKEFFKRENLVVN